MEVCPVRDVQCLCDITPELVRGGHWRNFYEIFLETPHFVLKKTCVRI